MLEKTLESPLGCKQIQPVHPKGDQSWVFIGRTDVEGETPILWPPNAKSWLIGKDLNAGKGWGQEEKEVTEDEMVGWHHGLNGHGFGCTPGVGDGQGGLVCCSSWGRKESDTTEQLNWTELNPQDLTGLSRKLNDVIYIRASGGASDKEPACQCRKHKRHGFDLWYVGLISGLGRSPGEWHVNPWSILTWRTPGTVEPGGLQFRVTKSWTQLKQLITQYV